MVDGLLIDSTLGITNYQKIAEGVASGQSATVKARLLGQLESDIYVAPPRSEARYAG